MDRDEFEKEMAVREARQERLAKAISDLFTIVDVNGNGEIDHAEQAKVMTMIHSMMLPRWRWELSSIDTWVANKSFEISKVKFKISESSNLRTC